MSGRPTVADLLRAETIKLASRASARLLVAALVVIAVGVPGVLFLLSHAMDVPADAAAQGARPPAFDLATVLSVVLWMRNFFVVRAGIIAVVAVSIAGEITARTMREDLVRPVSRGQVMAAKWGAIQVLVAVCALLPLALALPLGALLFESADVREPLLGFALTWLGDVGFATLVVAISTLLRSVPGTIGGVFLYWVVDRVLGWALWGVAKFRGVFDALFDTWKTPELKQVVDWIVAIRPWLPSSAFDVNFEQGLGDPIAWRSFAALAGYTAIAYLVASVTFRRIDVD